MAMTLRLEADTERALDSAARRTGKSKQHIVSEALNAYLGLTPTVISERAALIALGVLEPAAGSYHRFVEAEIVELSGSTDELLDRADRA